LVSVVYLFKNVQALKFGSQINLIILMFCQG
jgi:hypothetical protein